MRHPSLCLLLLCLLTSCGKDLADPRTPYTATVCIKFVSQDEGEKLKISAITNKATGKTKSINGTPNVELSTLDPAADTTTLVIEYGSNKTATVTLAYKRALSLISPQCGAQRAFTLTKVETTQGKATITEANLLDFSPDGQTREPNVQILL